MEARRQRKQLSSEVWLGLGVVAGDHTRRQVRFSDLVAKAVRASLGDDAATAEGPYARDGRIRVGFVSSYLRHHIVARFFAGFITGLDRAQFETWAWFNGDDADARVRPDQKVVVRRDWENIDARLRGTKALLETLVRIATKTPVAA